MRLAGAEEATEWLVAPDPSFTTCTAAQRWAFGGDAPRRVVAGEVELAPDDPRVALLGPRRNPQTGEPYPGTFRFSPRTGAELAQGVGHVGEDFGRPFDGTRGGPAYRMRQGAFRIGDAGQETLTLNPGRGSLFAAGKPSRLHCFHDNLGTLDWYDEETATWHEAGRLLDQELGEMGDLPDFAEALVTRADGVAYATGRALVFLPLPQLGPLLGAVVVTAPTLRVLGAPLLDGTVLAAPAALDGRLVVASGRLPLLAASGILAPELIAVDGAPDGAELDTFAPAVVDRSGVASWCGASGVVVFDRQAASARFVPWREGFSPILAQRPCRDRQDVFHQLGRFEGSYHYGQVGGSLLRSLPGPHLAVGTRTFWATETAESLDGQDREHLTLAPADAGRLVLPLLGLGLDTLVALVRLDSIKDFVAGEPLPASVHARLFHHQRHAGLHDLKVSLEMRSLFDVAAFVRGGRIHVHSRLENRCVALSVSS